MAESDFSCNFCGGKLVYDAYNEIFVCENCETKYPKEQHRFTFQEREQIEPYYSQLDVLFRELAKLTDVSFADEAIITNYLSSFMSIYDKVCATGLLKSEIISQQITNFAWKFNWITIEICKQNYYENQHLLGDVSGDNRVLQIQKGLPVFEFVRFILSKIITIQLDSKIKPPIYSNYSKYTDTVSILNKELDELLNCNYEIEGNEIGIADNLRDLNTHLDIGELTSEEHEEQHAKLLDDNILRDRQIASASAPEPKQKTEPKYKMIPMDEIDMHALSIEHTRYKIVVLLAVVFAGVTVGTNFIIGYSLLVSCIAIIPVVPFLFFLLIKFPDCYYKESNRRLLLIPAGILACIGIASIWTHLPMILAIIAMVFSAPTGKGISIMIVISAVINTVDSLIDIVNSINRQMDYAGFYIFSAMPYILFWLAFAGMLWMLNRRIFPYIIDESN